MPTLTTPLASFNQSTTQNCNVVRPERYRELLDIVKKPVIARGLGGSYGDAALNIDGQVVLMERLNRVLEFDRINGVITAEAGISLADILAVIVPAGWFLPVTPGTQYVTLGGCIAADVHGKNHHRTGSFEQHVLWLDVVIHDGEIIRCSSTQNSDLFWATIAGMGLTGIIGSASIKLIPLESAYMSVKHLATNNLQQTIIYLTDELQDDQYSVAWVDTASENNKFGRSIIMTAHHATLEELAPEQKSKPLKLFKQQQITIPYNCPGWLLNKKVIQLYNNYYYRTQSHKEKFLSHYQDYFYPLDKIKHWPRLYGKRGFIQYQCVLPHNVALASIQTILDHLQKNNYSPFLTVLKQFGKASNTPLSFPMPGLTLAMDIPIKDNKLFSLLDEIDEIVVQNEGRIYLAKDARLTPARFQIMYPRYVEWLAIKKKWDPKNNFSSSLARRLGI